MNRIDWLDYAKRNGICYSWNVKIYRYCKETDTKCRLGHHICIYCIYNNCSNIRHQSKSPNCCCQSKNFNVHLMPSAAPSYLASSAENVQTVDLTLSPPSSRAVNLSQSVSVIVRKTPAPPGLFHTDSTTHLANVSEPASQTAAPPVSVSTTPAHPTAMTVPPSATPAQPAATFEPPSAAQTQPPSAAQPQPPSALQAQTGASNTEYSPAWKPNWANIMKTFGQNYGGVSRVTGKKFKFDPKKLPSLPSNPQKRKVQMENQKLHVPPVGLQGRGDVIESKPSSTDVQAESNKKDLLEEIYRLQRIVGDQTKQIRAMDNENNLLQAKQVGIDEQIEEQNRKLNMRVQKQFKDVATQTSSCFGNSMFPNQRVGSNMFPNQTVGNNMFPNQVVGPPARRRQHLENIPPGYGNQAHSGDASTFQLNQTVGNTMFPNQVVGPPARRRQYLENIPPGYGNQAHSGDASTFQLNIPEPVLALPNYNMLF